MEELKEPAPFLCVVSLLWMNLDLPPWYSIKTWMISLNWSGLLRSETSQVRTIRKKIAYFLVYKKHLIHYLAWKVWNNQLQMLFYSFGSIRVKKWKEISFSEEKIISHQDNASAHRSVFSRAKLDKIKYELLENLPYSTDLAPSNLFRNLELFFHEQRSN